MELSIMIISYLIELKCMHSGIKEIETHVSFFQASLGGIYWVYEVMYDMMLEWV